ncbi:MAG: hypothetical protein KGM49_00940 [Sphingomonadales bacterium]|nr:hypothetical protein [Sphingomonadales bacterium]
MRLTNSRHRHRYARAHGALRIALGDVMGVTTTPEFRRSRSGRPFLADGPHFSMSHAGEKSWLAISETPVGLDVVETGKSRGSLDETFVSARDLQALALHGISSENADVIAWAAKEACAKHADDVDRAPGDWQLHRDGELVVRSCGHAPIAIELCHPERGYVAVIARWQAPFQIPEYE